MRILIRADGGSRIGMGHLARTSVLAEKLMQYAELVYICRNEEQYLPGVTWLQDRKYEVELIDSSNMLEQLALKKADCLITDSYAVDEEYFLFTKEMFPYTGYIDDLNRNRFRLDFLINQNVYAKDMLIDINEGARLFLGAEYAMLRKEFENIKDKEISKDIKSILVTVGGSDDMNYTRDIICNIRRAYTGIKLNIVIGPFFRYKDSLLAMDDSNIVFHQNANMSELMRSCDVAITGCGSTIYELAACGVPSIGIVVADNQSMAADKMQQMGALYKAKPTDIPAILQKLDYTARREMSGRARQLVDGQGSSRLVDGIINILRGR